MDRLSLIGACLFFPALSPIEPLQKQGEYSCKCKLEARHHYGSVTNGGLHHSALFLYITNIMFTNQNEVIR